MSKKNQDQFSVFGDQPLENQAVITEEPEVKENEIEEETVESQMNVEPVKRGRGRPAKKLVNAIREQRKQGVLIPEKLYFAISEVAEICGVKPYVLRYWESEFKLLRPSKNPSGQRMYQRKDIDMVFKIKKYLYEEGFTISGAKKKLKEDRKAAQQEGLQAGSHEMLSKIKGELSNILKSVKK